MKLFASVSWLALALTLTGLISGCASSDYRTAQRIEQASDIEVVETSARRPLTDREMGELRGTVARYLDQQGKVDTGDYYLKVYLTPDVEGVTPEWVVVRFTRYSDTRVSVADYPTAYPYAGSYYSYDAYPYGYDGFSRISFQYYDDPYYGRRYYYPRHDHRDRDHPRNPGAPNHGNHPPGGNGTPFPPPGSVGGNNPPPRPDNPRRRTPDRIAPPSVRPNRSTETGTRSAPPGQAQASQAPVAGQQRPVNPQRAPATNQWRGRNEASSNAPRAAQPPRSESRPQPPQASAPAYRPPAPDRTPPSSSNSNDNRDDVKKAN